MIQLDVNTSMYKRAKSTNAKANAQKAESASMVISHTTSEELNHLPLKDFQLKMRLKNQLWLLLIMLSLEWMEILKIWSETFKSLKVPHHLCLLMMTQ